MNDRMFSNPADCLAGFTYAELNGSVFLDELDDVPAAPPATAAEIEETEQLVESLARSMYETGELA